MTELTGTPGTPDRDIQPFSFTPSYVPAPVNQPETGNSEKPLMDLEEVKDGVDLQAIETAKGRNLQGEVDPVRAEEEPSKSQLMEISDAESLILLREAERKRLGATKGFSTVLSQPRTGQGWLAETSPSALVENGRRTLLTILVSFIVLAVVGFSLWGMLSAAGTTQRLQEPTKSDVTAAVALVEGFTEQGLTVTQAVAETQPLIPGDLKVAVFKDGSGYLVHTARALLNDPTGQTDLPPDVDKDNLYNYGYSSATGEYGEFTWAQLLETIPVASR